MRRPVRALYRILVCTALLVFGVRASDDSQMIIIDSDSKTKTPISSSIQNEDINLLPEFLDDSLENSASFKLTQTKKIRTAHYACSPSCSIILHKHDIYQPMENTEQSGPLSSSYGTVCEPGAEYTPVCCIPNESVQKHTKSVSLGNYEQSNPKKRHKKAMEENTPRKKQRKTEESTTSGLDSDSTEDDELNISRINRIKMNISIWNNSRLKNRHRENQHSGYKPAVSFDKIGRNKYKEIGDEIHQSLIETYIKYCKAAYNTTPAQNEFWFAIASRSTFIHTKHADCKAMNKNPLEYKFIEGLSGYYSGLPGDIVRYMNKYGPIVSKQESIKTEWTETLGDIHVREPAKLENGIGKKTITFETNNKYRPVATAVRMILGLSEVYKDLTNLTIEFIEKALKGISLKNLVVIEALYEIVEQHKSSNKLEPDDQYIILYNVFANILHQTDVSYEFIVIQLYTEMYKSLVYFYEKAKVCEEISDIEKKRRKEEKEKEYYLLAGKCIIKSQKYLKCTTTIYLNKKDMGAYTHQITEETDKWSIPSDIHNHYHIHYVDNTKQQYRRVCMPMCLGPIHTISQIINYLKRLYSIEKKKCICPYKQNTLGYWKYIQEEERDKTVQDFTECDIVFYYIEEGIRENYFTFAEFESYVQPKGETVRIPLFLSPLMRSAISMGPFEAKDKKEHKLVDSIQFIFLWPSVYTYKEEYKAIEYSHVHHYYSNLYIQRDNEDVPTIDCYIMNSKANIDNDTVTVEWCANIFNSVDEYMHCLLSDKLINDQGKYNAFRKAVMSQEYTPDSALYGFCLQSSLEKTRGLDDTGCSTNDSIDSNNIANCKLSIIPIHKISTDKLIADIQSKIDELDREAEQIKIMINESGTTEELKKKLKRKRQNLYQMKSKNRQKLRNIQSKDQLLIKEEFSATLLPPCSFLVFRHSNTQAKSSLGAHNEILDVFSCRYNNSNSKLI